MTYSLIFIVLFVVVVVWAFGKKRKSRFKNDAEIPFHERKD